MIEQKQITVATVRWLHSPWLGQTVSANDAIVLENDATFKANSGPYPGPYSALPMVLVLEQVRLGERCHSLGERCHFLSKPGSLPRSVLRTTNGFGFKASACVVDFNVKWRRYGTAILYLNGSLLVPDLQNWLKNTHIRISLIEKGFDSIPPQRTGI